MKEVQSEVMEQRNDGIDVSMESWQVHDVHSVGNAMVPSCCLAPKACRRFDGIHQMSKATLAYRSEASTASLFGRSSTLENRPRPCCSTS